MVISTKTDGMRLSEFRKHKGFTQKEFADQLGCSQPNLNKIENGNTGISSSMRAKIFESFPEINRDWLDNGTGSMTISLPDTNLLSGSNATTFNKDLNARFMSNLDKIEMLLEEGKLPYDSIITVFKNLRKILDIQEDKIKNLLEDKQFLKNIIVTSKNSPFTKGKSQ